MSLESAGLLLGCARDIQWLPTAGNGSEAAAAARGCGSWPGPVTPGSTEPFRVGRDGKAKGLFPHASTTFLPILPDPGQTRASDPCPSKCLDGSCPASPLPQPHIHPLHPISQRAQHRWNQQASGCVVLGCCCVTPFPKMHGGFQIKSRALLSLPSPGTNGSGAPARIRGVCQDLPEQL